MIERAVNLLNSNHILLFGPRGSGKTSLIESSISSKESYRIDLLLPRDFDRFLVSPELLISIVDSLDKNIKYLVIDEVQKIPALLDVVHSIIEKQKARKDGKKINFILTGSSARKLKRGQGNLLAGRAVQKYLFPLTYLELGKKFNLDQALQWGLLPQVYFEKSIPNRLDYMITYAQTYIKEEILAEQVIRKLEPFRKFLQVAAQSSGKIINFQNIADDIGVSNITVQSYFQILEDSLLGFYLPSYNKSVRKAQRLAPKFYLIDTGISRVLSRTIELPLVKESNDYGNHFECFLVAEIYKLTKYYRPLWEISYLRTQHDVEIDLIIDRPGLPLAVIEIKSSEKITERNLKNLNLLMETFKQQEKDQKGVEFYCFSNDPINRIEGEIHVLHWTEVAKRLQLSA